MKDDLTLVGISVTLIAAGASLSGFLNLPIGIAVTILGGLVLAAPLLSRFLEWVANRRDRYTTREVPYHGFTTIEWLLTLSVAFFAVVLTAQLWNWSLSSSKSATVEPGVSSEHAVSLKEAMKRLATEPIGSGTTPTEEPQHNDPAGGLKSGREVEYHGGKTPLLSQTLAEIQKKVEEALSFQRPEALKPFVGKWMRVEGAVADVDRREEEWVIVIDRPIRSFGIWCYFKDDISHVERGDRVRLIGKLGPSVTYFSLSECELLDPPER